MKYKNRRTGAVINTSGKISGGDWEEIPVAPTQSEIKEKTEPEKKTAPPVKKNTTRTAVKKPAAKKATSRKKVES